MISLSANAQLPGAVAMRTLDRLKNTRCGLAGDVHTLYRCGPCSVRARSVGIASRLTFGYTAEMRYDPLPSPH